MPIRTVLMHEVTVHPPVGAPTTFDANDITVLQVIRRRLIGHGQPMEVDRVELSYRAADGQDYTTLVRAGDSGSADGADHIIIGPAAVPPSPRPPEEMPARNIRGGETFAVIAHSPKEQADMSKNLETGWHRSDCTWFYPY